MKYFSNFTILIFSCFLFSSCYRDKEELLYGIKNTADCSESQVNVSYNSTVVPILQKSCYGCHGAGSALGGIAMGTHASDKSIADNGKLSGSINHSPGYSPMPKSSPQLSKCELSIIKKWIDSGSPNN